MVRKSQIENPTDQITAALDTPVNLEWSATAEKLNISVPDFQERVAAKLNDSTVFAWENLPVEHEPLVEAIARDLESESSARRLTPEPEEAPQLPPQPPILENEPQPQKRGGHLKKQSSDLTKRKSSKLKESDQKAQQLAASDQQVKVALHARKGQKLGAQLATIELAELNSVLRVAIKLFSLVSVDFPKNFLGQFTLSKHDVRRKIVDNFDVFCVC
jgi:hypothetical protein